MSTSSLACMRRPTYVQGLPQDTSDQKLLIEKDQDEDAQDRALCPLYSISGRNHVEYVDDFLVLLIQKSLAGKDDSGRMLALGADSCPEARHLLLV